MTASTPAERRRGPALGLALLALLPGGIGIAGCRAGERRSDPAADDELQTVEVAPPPDALVDPSRDVQERRRAEAFSGVLPESFPKGLPLPAGASLVDQGPRWVELLVGRAPATVRGEYLAQLRSAGWQVAAAGSGEHRLSRRGARAVLRFSADGPSARLRLEY